MRMRFVAKTKVIAAILACISLFLSVFSSASPAHNGLGVGDNEIDLLLKIAREYRDGSGDVPRNYDRAVHFFQYVLEQSREQQSETTIAASSELYKLLLEHPQLKSKYSRWQLLTLVAEQGNSDAQHELATALGSGVYLDGIVPMDAAKSLLLEYASALSGHPLANMAMGYRYMHGIGVVQSCDRALPHYEYAANLAAEYIESHVLQPTIERLRPSDLPSFTSRSSSGAGVAAARGAAMSRQDISIELAEYYAHLAEAGDVSSANILGTFYMYGSRTLKRNPVKAMYYLEMAVKQQYAPAAGMLGYFLAMTYVKENAALQNGNYSYAAQYPATKILELLRMGEKKGDVYGILGVAFANEHGLAMERNLTRAMELYNKCMHVHADAGYYAGELRLRQLATSSSSSSSTNPAQSVSELQTTLTNKQNSRNYEVSAALHAYYASSGLGNVLATHRLGHMTIRGMGTARSCEAAVQAFKTVAERGPWMVAMEQVLHVHRPPQQSVSSSTTAQRVSQKSSKSQDVTNSGAPSLALQSLWHLLPLAVAGVENAQFLSAYLLTQQAEHFPLLSPAPPIVPSPTTTSEKWSQHNVSSVTHIPEEQWQASLDLPRILRSRRSQAASSDQLEDLSATIAHKETVKKVMVRSEQWRRWLHTYLHTNHKSGQSIAQFMPDQEELELSVEAAHLRQQLAEMRALGLLGLSASQGNSHALVMLGDFHYYGSASLLPAPATAARYYQRAADLHHTQATFNLGVMHEVGDGVAQDFHLAKRFYDLAAEGDAKARVPRDLALCVLDLHRRLLAHLGKDNWIWQYLDMSSLEMMRVLAMELVRWMDFLNNEIVDYFQQFTTKSGLFPVGEDAISQHVPAKQRVIARHYMEVLWDVLTEIGVNLSTAMSKMGQVKVLVMEHDEIMLLVGLSFLFVSLIMTKILLWRRERQLFA